MRKGVKKPLYAVTAGLAFVAGLMVLSVTQPSDGVSTPSQIDVPEVSGNHSIPGEIPELNSSMNVTPPDIPRQSNMGGNDVIKGAAKAILKALTGMDFSGTSAGSSGNVSVPDMNGSEPDNKTDTPPDSNVTDDLSNVTEPDLPEGNSSKPNPNNGFLKSLLKSISGLFDFSDTNSSSDSDQPKEPDKPSPKDPDKGDPLEPQTPEKEPDNPRSADDAEGSSSLIPNIDNLKKLFTPLLIGILIIAIFIGYRSNIDFVGIFKSLSERLKEFIISLPDLFSRLIVSMSAYILNFAGKTKEILFKLIRSPFNTIEKVLESLKNSFNSFNERLENIKEGGVSSVIQNVSSGGKSGGLTGLWYMIKKKSGLTGSRSYTPVEVGQKAIDSGMDSSIINDVVKAYRWEKYSPTGYKEDLRIDYWRNKLGDDE